MTSAFPQYAERLRAARERLIGTNINDPALSYCIEGVERVEQVLRRPLRVVILGENNSGKTSVTDLLIGQGLLPTSVLSNTRAPVLIGHADKPAIFGVDQDGTRIRIDSDDESLLDLSYRALQLALPIAWLKGYQILDTPPSTAPAAFVGDADIVIWCTVATRAWTESERAAWAALPQRCSRNALLVATHKDGLDTEDDARRVAERLRSLTMGQFRDVILVDAEGVDDGDEAASRRDPVWTGADALRAGVARLASDIADRKTQKAEKIVRRLARLTFHHFGSDEVRSEAVELLMRWEAHAGHLLKQLQQGDKTVPETIEALLTVYALCAEKLRPGVVRGDDTIPASTSRALAAPIRWPRQTSAAARLVQTLASDLTGLLRMLAGHSTFVDPAVRAEYQAARAIVLTLADLDGAFDALGRMLGSSMVSEQRSSAGPA